jgi:hypothetical protein
MVKYNRLAKLIGRVRMFQVIDAFLPAVGFGLKGISASRFSASGFS